MMNQTYSKSFFCAYNIRLYPFDTQVVYISAIIKLDALMFSFRFVI